jgi:WD40 repeat protein
MSKQLEYQECYHKPGHESVIKTMVLSPDGRRLLTGSDDSSVIVWSTKTGTILCRIKARSPVLSLAFLTNSNRFLFGCQNGLIVSVSISAVCALTWGLAPRSSGLR